MRGDNRADGLLALPDTYGGVSADHAPASECGSVTCALLLGEVLFHREALARALDAYDDIALVGSVADVHAALILAEERKPGVLIVDSPSDAVAQALGERPLACKLVVIGAVGERCRQLERRGDAILVGAGASLDELRVALRFATPRDVARSLSPRTGGDADSNLTLREREVSHLVGGGCSNKEIANACGISIATVKNHVHRILGKLKLRRRSQIAGLVGNQESIIPLKRATPP